MDSQLEKELEILELCESDDIGLPTELSLWLDFYNDKSNDIPYFICLLKKHASFADCEDNPLQIDDPNVGKYPKFGFFERDFLILANKNKEKISAAATRIVLAMNYGIRFQSLKKSYFKKALPDLIEIALIEGEYEKYNIDFTKVLKMAILNKSLPKSSIPHIALMRGIMLGERYKTIKEKIMLLFEKVKNYIFINGYVCYKNLK